MSLSPRRAVAAVVLCIAAAALLAVAVAHTYNGAPPRQRATGVQCPDSPAQLAGRHLLNGQKLPDLRCADLTNAVFDGLSLTQASLAGAHAQGASFQDADLSQVDLTGADLRGAHFDGADLSQADLLGVDAVGASFSGADLSQAHATGAVLRGADLGSADLTQATLKRADLRSANLAFASVTQADLTGADLRGAKLWLTGSIQAGTSGVRVGALEPGVVQLPYLLAVVLLALAVRRTVAGIRRPRGPSTSPVDSPSSPESLWPVSTPYGADDTSGPPAAPGRPAPLGMSAWPGAPVAALAAEPLPAGALLRTLALCAVGFAVAAGFVSLTMSQLVAVWFVDSLVSLPVAGVVFLVFVAVGQLRPRTANTRSTAMALLGVRQR